MRASNQFPTIVECKSQQLQRLHATSQEEVGRAMLRYQTQGNTSTHKKLQDGLYVSNLQGVPLAEYIIGRRAHCQAKHASPCKRCDQVLCVAEIVLQFGQVKLKEVWESVFQKPYSSSNALVTLLQLPLLCMALTSDQWRSTGHRLLHVVPAL